jgi:putative transposase
MLMAESFNATIKKELIHLHTWPTLKAVRHAVFEYIEVYYNRKRPHTSIGNTTPSKMEHNSLRTIDGERAEAA